MTPEERANAAAVQNSQPVIEPRRHLSWPRLIGTLVVLLLIAAGIAGFRSRTHQTAAAAPTSSFAPYVDVTATPQFPFEDPAQSSSTNLVLGFVVSAPGSACEPSWGGAYSMSAAATQMDLDRRIARLRQRDGEVSVSFGGAANSELSIGCTDVAKLTAAYRSVVDRYQVDTIDLDIEGAAALAPAVVARRAQAIKALQLVERAQGRNLNVWLTLPVDPSGVTAAGLAAINEMLGAEVELSGVNAMTMDYGESAPAGQTMARVSETALTALQRQLSAAYSRQGVSLSDASVWQRIGATPMIGQNDIVSERFELSDAEDLVAFAERNHLRRLSMWSVNRDQSCGPNYANVEIVSDNCSGVTQKPQAFTKAFSRFTSVGATADTGTPSPRPTATGTASVAPDDPSTSPYPIWNPAQGYAKGTKTVWHHNVYEAKWWTQGDTPDAPVASLSDTPWTLIGPVLPGERPVATPTLKAGTYPDWNPNKAYAAGSRVMQDGVGYQAKWWTQGEPPNAIVLDPSAAPWQLITSP